MRQRPCTSLEQCGALHDILEIANEYGDFLTIYIRTESNVNRDKYGDLKSGDIDPSTLKITMPAFPITFNPNSRQLEKAGCREECELLCYTPMISWTTAGYVFDDIDVIRTTVDYNGHKYVIKEKGLAGQFTDTFLQITLALKRK